MAQQMDPLFSYPTQTNLLQSVEYLIKLTPNRFVCFFIYIDDQAKLASELKHCNRIRYTYSWIVLTLYHYIHKYIVNQ